MRKRPIIKFKTIIRNNNPHQDKRKNHPDTADFLLLTASLLIFDHIGRGKQVVQTIIKETEQEKYSPGGTTLTIQEWCQRQSAVANLFTLVCALQESTELDFNSISKQTNKENYFSGI